MLHQPHVFSLHHRVIVVDLCNYNGTRTRGAPRKCVMKRRSIGGEPRSLTVINYRIALIFTPYYATAEASRKTTAHPIGRFCLLGRHKDRHGPHRSAHRGVDWANQTRRCHAVKPVLGVTSHKTFQTAIAVALACSFGDSSAQHFSTKGSNTLRNC
jgi:hypothetical protein